MNLEDKILEAQFTGVESSLVAKDLNNPEGANSSATTKPIEKSDIREYLRVTGSWLGFKRSTSDAAELAMDSLMDNPGSYDVSNTLVLGMLTSTLQGVVDDATVPGFASIDMAYILSLGSTTESWAQANGVRITPARIQKLRGEI